MKKHLLILIILTSCANQLTAQTSTTPALATINLSAGASFSF